MDLWLECVIFAIGRMGDAYLEWEIQDVCNCYLTIPSDRAYGA